MDAVQTVPASLIERLRARLGAEAVVDDQSTRRALAVDQLRRRRGAARHGRDAVVPAAVVRPRTTEDVVTVLELAAGARVPVVSYGGGTGLMGGARTVMPGIVLDLRAMDKILAVAADDLTVTAQAGAVLGDVNAALALSGLMLGHDPWTVPIATVGGTIATNSLGYRGAQYGSMGDQVLGLAVVLGDGRLVRTRAVPRSSTGPRLTRLFAGAEGVLGVVTEATLRVFPLPERRELIALDFPAFAAGHAAVRAMFAIGLVPAVIDYGGPPGGAARMYLGFEGLAGVVAAQAARGRVICAEHDGAERDPRLAERFWAERHVPPERLRAWREAEADEPLPGEPGSAVFDYLHMALPASRVLPFIDQAEAIFARHGVSVREWGLWNQPELLSTVITRPTDTAEELAEATAAVDAALMLVQDMGGSMEYVHGAGLRYAHLMEREHGAGLSLLRDIKRATDPAGILNPGKLGL